MFRLGVIFFISWALTYSAQAIEFQGNEGFKRYQGVVCPSIPEEYETAIKSIESLTEDIAKESNCTNLTEKLKGFGLIEGEHNKFLDIVTAKKGKKLSATEASFVDKYAQSVASQVSSVFAAFSASKCPIKENREQKTLLENSMTDLAYSVVTGLSDIAGPYGMPIRIAGSALKAIVKGVHDFRKNRSGYLFDDTVEGEEEVIAFTKSLCLFYNYRIDLSEKLLEPKVRRTQLMTARKLVEAQMQAVRLSCPSCSILGSRDSLSKENIPFWELPVESQQTSLEDTDSAFFDSNEISNSKDWIDSQLKLIRKEEQNKEYVSLGPALLMRKLDRLEDYIFGEHASPFMDWITERTEEQYEMFIKDSRARLYPFIHGLQMGYRAPRVTITRKGVKTPSLYFAKKKLFFRGVSKYDMENDFVSLRDYYAYLKEKYADKPEKIIANGLDSSLQRSLREMLTYKFFLNAHDEYCDFFRRINMFNEVLSQCMSKDLKVMADVFDKEFGVQEPEEQEIQEDSYSGAMFEKWQDAVEDNLEKEREKLRSFQERINPR